MIKRCVWVIGVLAAGCSGGNSNTVGVAQNAAGIVMVQVDKLDTRTVARGLDAKGAVVATATMDVGIVDWTPPDEVGAQSIFGRHLLVQANDGKEIEHTSPGTEALHLPPPPSKTMAIFLGLPQMQTVFPGVEFQTPPQRSAERAYDIVSQEGGIPCDVCDVDRSPSCGTNRCSSMGHYLFAYYDQVNYGYGDAPNHDAQFVCCDGSNTYVARECTGNANSSNQCGATGSLGCSVCWSGSYSNYCDTYSSWDDTYGYWNCVLDAG